MEKEFVPYELAVKLKALGFDEPCLDKYDPRFEKLSSNMETWSNEYYPENLMTPAPTFSQVFRWFREKYGLFIQPNRTIDSEGTWYYFSIASKRTDVCEGSFVYEEAELACLDKLIEIVEKK